MIKSIIAIVLAGMLAACAGNSVKTTKYGCITATGVEFSIAQYNSLHPLPKAEQDTILVYVNKVDAICKAPTPATDAQLKSAAFQEAAAFLVAEAAKLGAK